MQWVVELLKCGRLTNIGIYINNSEANSAFCPHGLVFMQVGEGNDLIFFADERNWKNGNHIAIQVLLYILMHVVANIIMGQANYIDSIIGDASSIA